MKHLALFLVIAMTCSAAEETIRWGLSARQGDRKTMEDTHLHIFPFHNNAKRGLFGIFDGHSGADAALIAAERFPEFIPSNDNCSEEILSKAFLDLDSLILQSTEDGTCALVAHIFQNKLHLAWAGDSRAVLVRKDAVAFATTDHKPDYEKDRIKKMGGWIFSLGGVSRLNGILAVSRALGNKCLKDKGVLTAEPDVCSASLKSGDLLILACDGIWDVFSNEDALKVVHKALTLSKNELELLYPARPLVRKFEIIEGSLKNLVEPCNAEYGDEHLKLVARALRDEAYLKGSSDNLSVEIVAFK